MYYCEDCKNEFDEPEIEKTTYEDFYEIASMFPNKNEMILEKCPHCGSENIEDMETCDKCGEFCRYEDLIDSERKAGGGIGFLCPDCARDCEV